MNCLYCVKCECCRENEVEELKAELAELKRQHEHIAECIKWWNNQQAKNKRKNKSMRPHQNEKEDE